MYDTALDKSHNAYRFYIHRVHYPANDTSLFFSLHGQSLPEGASFFSNRRCNVPWLEKRGCSLQDWEPSHHSLWAVSGRETKEHTTHFIMLRSNVRTCEISWHS